MKKILAVMVTIVILGLTGCVHMTEITEEESETIARTAAWLLFKYDKNYTENLVTPSPTPTPTMTPTPTVTPVVTEAPEKTKQEEPTRTEEPNPLPQETVTPERLLNLSSAGEIGTEEIHISFDGYELHDSYTFESFSVEPTNPQKCLMLIFLKLINTGQEKSVVNILELQPKCRLYADGTELMVPKKTMLLNDFQYLLTELESEEELSSVLVFEVSKEFSPNTLDLYISVGENTAHINLQ